LGAPPRIGPLAAWVITKTSLQQHQHCNIATSTPAGRVGGWVRRQDGCKQAGGIDPEPSLLLNRNPLLPRSSVRPRGSPDGWSRRSWRSGRPRPGPGASGTSSSPKSLVRPLSGFPPCLSQSLSQLHYSVCYVGTGNPLLQLVSSVGMQTPKKSPKMKKGFHSSKPRV